MLTRSSLFFAAVAVLFPVVGAFADVTIDVSGATKVSLPSSGSFKTSDGKEGWVVKLSDQAIPTPAFAKGRIYTGAGVSASRFLALDAGTGKTIWEERTTDNGPTSPVVSDDGHVSYNTECCDTETRDIDSGEISWHETNGGSLLTAPVVVGSTLIIPHPTMARTSQMADDSFRMMAVDVKSGKHTWDRNMTADVMAAPIASGTRVYFTCVDGRVFCLPLTSDPGWHVKADATSAPVVVGNTLAVTVEEKTADGAMVSIQRYAADTGDLIDEKPLVPTAVKSATATRGNQATWDYQGPKIAAAGNHLFNAPGVTINSVDVTTGKTIWRGTVSGGGLFNAINALTPPALGKENLYLGTNRGQIMGVKQADGKLAFAYDIGVPLASQPILADGNIYFGTANGLLVCIKLNNPDAKDWTAWGGNSQHNKVE